MPSPFELRPENVVGFAFSTIVFLALCGGVLHWGRTSASKLVLLGILVAVVSIAYGLFVNSPTAIPLTTGLMKIAVILVLGGVACYVLSCLGGPPVTDTPTPKEPIHE